MQTKVRMGEGRAREDGRGLRCVDGDGDGDGDGEGDGTGEGWWNVVEVFE